MKPGNRSERSKRRIEKARRRDRRIRMVIRRVADLAAIIRKEEGRGS